MKDLGKILTAVSIATTSNVSHMTNDRIEALAGGHGMINVAVHAAANVIVEEIKNGGAVSIKFADTRKLPVATTIEKAIDAAKKAGANGANAALIVAVLMYLAGSKAQIGIPAGNRKLGATCRMIAGVDRSGVAAIPTAKMNSKISAFPAVLAINQAMMRGEFVPIDGRDVPMNVGGGPLYGHSTLGEDIVWPGICKKGTEIGVNAMIDAMAGAGIIPDKLQAALLGSAAVLEIIHPDAEVPEGFGKYGRTTSVRLVGEQAIKTAGLPEKVHLLITGQEFDTAQLVGDIGLILKDIGAPSVIGMMILQEILAIFEEGISSGFSTAPVNPPLGHKAAYAVIAMKALLDGEMDYDEIKEKIVEQRYNSSVYPESAITSIYVMYKKANEVKRGEVTQLLIDASQPLVTRAIYEKAVYTYNEIEKGKDITEIVKALDDERVRIVEENSGKIFSNMTGHDVKVKVNEIRPAARRTIKLVKKYWSFDPYADVTVTMDGKKAELKGLCHDIIPKVCLKDPSVKEIEWAVPLGAAVIDDLTLGGCNILNVVVPVAVAAAMDEEKEIKDIAKAAEKAAYITVGIPGAKDHSTAVAKYVRDIIKVL